MSARAALLVAVALHCSSPPTESSSSAPAARSEPAKVEPSFEHRVAASPTGADSPAKDSPAGAAAARPKPARKRWSPRPDDPTKPHHAVEFPEALAYFFEQLGQVDDGLDDGLDDELDARRVVRVIHLGASMIGTDDLTSVLRGKFQARFGDGGAGMVMMQRYMNNYVHRWVKLSGRGWKHCYIGYLCRPDGHYGLGGVTFSGGPGASTTVATRTVSSLGGSASHLEVWYAAQPRGGSMSIAVNDAPAVLVPTRADELDDRFYTAELEPGPHTVVVRPKGGKVRAYGVVLETDRGVVWDQFSWLGAFTKRMHGWDPAHIEGQVRQRDPALLVFTFGGNDTRRIANRKLTPAGYTAEYVKGIMRVRAGKPEASCLVTAMTDRSRSLKFDVTAVLHDVVEAQREAAKQAGCAFFDSFAAMGGRGSLAQWRRRSPPLAAPDRKHLNHAGREVLGGWIYDAIVAAYVASRMDVDARAAD